MACVSECVGSFCRLDKSICFLPCERRMLGIKRRDGGLFGAMSRCRFLHVMAPRKPPRILPSLGSLGRMFDAGRDRKNV